MSKTVVVIIPTYNEQANIVPVVRELARVFRQIKSFNFHILFVDDNSPDGSAKVISTEIKRHAHIRLLSNKRKGGLGHAYKKGMRYAIQKLHADIIVQFDGDLSHDPNKLPAMLDKIEGGSDMVLGSRYMRGGGIPPHWPPDRKFLSIVGNLFIRLVMFNFKVHDWTTGYRVITKELVEKILPVLRHSAFNGYTWQIGFLVKSIQAGFKVDEVPFVFKDRTEGHSKLGPEYIFNTVRYIMKVRIEEILRNRLVKFALTGGTGAVIQLVTLELYRNFAPFQLAFFLAIETAILSNFTLSNLWTFSDRKLKLAQVPAKFLTFNLTSGGSILIQQLIAFLGEKYIGLLPLFTLPIINFKVDTGTMYAVAGIFMGMFWNFFAYSKIIWKAKTK